MDPQETEPIEPFNWHAADRDSFMYWAVASMLSRHLTELKQIMQASDGATALRIVIEINGVKIPGVPFFEKLWEEMQQQAQVRAAALVEAELTQLHDTRESVDRIMKMAAADVRRRFKELGFPMEENFDEW
jgi:hypothetical protein